ncbi:MAG: histidine-type phosphatase [Syntrophobacteraceae bacterium]
MTFNRMVIVLGLVLVLIVPVQVPAQRIKDNDGTILKQIIIFGRHSIRSSAVDLAVLQPFAVDVYPPFEVATGCLTPNGRSAEKLLGTYFRSYLLHEGLLTGDDHTDAAHLYFRSNSIERSWATAHAFGTGLIPKLTVPVHSFPVNPQKPDPVFDPIAAGVAKVNPNLAATQVREIFNSGKALAAAYSGEFSLIRSVLFDYPLGTLPPPPTPQYCPQSSETACIDPTALPIPLTANTQNIKTGEVINVGGLSYTGGAADPFVMQYADGKAPDDVAWGRLPTLELLSQVTRLADVGFSIAMRTPYLSRVQSSNAASHILRTMQQTVTGSEVPGAFGGVRSRIVAAISSDTYVAGLAGLLNLHWQLPGYQPDFCAPGGALVFETRQIPGRARQFIVRVYYTAQTFEQLRHLSPLTKQHPPATIQLLVPGGSKSATNLDVDFNVFQKLMSKAIGRQYVEDPSQEVPPGVLTGVTCQ